MVKRYKTPEHALKVNFCREPASPPARQQKDYCCILKSFFVFQFASLEYKNSTELHLIHWHPLRLLRSSTSRLFYRLSDGVLINTSLFYAGIDFSELLPEIHRIFLVNTSCASSTFKTDT